ncbi:S-adenosyl-L-methionine-dependent methyltransferase [Tricladium varicosporioides]|nr:S-adenosyl-L-methionine-dependent methyltransferase [Hymenoscyphus varicosporioides]
MTSSSSAALYNSRASTYDTATSFHSRLTQLYPIYLSPPPSPGSSLLDLACGTGLVTFAFLPIIAPEGLVAGQNIIGVDISRGMLDVACSKLPPNQTNIKFIEHDITSLESIPQLNGLKATFDIITCASALVLLDDPRKAIEEWVEYLKPSTGRLIIDVPSTKSMLGLKILGDLKEEFGFEMLGERRWIHGPQSLRDLMESVGLVSEVLETESFGDVPARTKILGKGGDEAVWGVDEGGEVFDGLAEAMGGWEELGREKKERARAMFEERWREEGNGEGVVKEEGSLYVGVGIRG